MVRLGRFLLVTSVAAVLMISSQAALAAASSPMGSSPIFPSVTGTAAAPIQPWLATELERTGPSQQLPVLVHGSDLKAARAAVTRSGLTPLRDLKRIAVTIARGTPSQVQFAARQPGVTYVEGNQPIEFHLGSSHEATRSEEASASLARDGRTLDGAGVSVAVIDSGIDPTHPFFTDSDGESIVVANLKHVCGVIVSEPGNCFVDVGPLVDTDTASAGGHGTHVNGIVAGQRVDLANGEQLRGAAPGARLVSLSMGAGLVIINAHLGLEWVLENHAAPCGVGISPEQCPPIKAVNNSYGPVGGGEFDPNGAAVKLQRALAAEGVVTVWSNGNGGGDGSTNQSNPAGQDPTLGVISVASYFDENTGTRDGVLSEYSSRGDKQRPPTWPDISAPGQSITSACRPYLAICSTGSDPQNGAGPTDIGAYNTISGTSMAAPHIAGIVAQLFQADPTATPAELEHALKSTAYRYTDGAAYQTVGDDSGSFPSSFDKGAGLVDVAAAVPALSGWTSATEEEDGSEADGVVDEASSETAESAASSVSPSTDAENVPRETSASSSSASTKSAARSSAAVPVVTANERSVRIAKAAEARADGGATGGSLWWFSIVAVLLLGASAWFLAGGSRVPGD